MRPCAVRVSSDSYDIFVSSVKFRLNKSATVILGRKWSVRDKIANMDRVPRAFIHFCFCFCHSFFLETLIRMNYLLAVSNGSGLPDKWPHTLALGHPYLE